MNEQNLKPFTLENAAYWGRKGGIASGESRRRAAALKREEKFKKTSPSPLSKFKLNGVGADCTQRQLDFLLSYMGWSGMACAARAARAAGYSPRSAKEIGYQLTHNRKLRKVWMALVDMIREGKRM